MGPASYPTNGKWEGMDLKKTKEYIKGGGVDSE